MSKRRLRLKEAEFEPSHNVAGLRLPSYLPFLVGQVYLRRARILDVVLKPARFTEHEWRILVVLSDNNGCTMSKMADWTVLDRSTMSRTLTVMERRGLVRRKLRESDRRVTEIYITKKGWDSYSATLPIVEAVSEKMLTGLSKHDVDQLSRTLRKLMFNISAVELD